MERPEPLPLLKADDRPLVHLGLFGATWLTSFASFFFVMGGGVASQDPWDQARGALLFSTATMAILLAHEMGHFVFSRRHGVDSSLPWFIPLPPPLSPFGTLGAVIRLRGRVPDRNALVDIGAAGPLAGLAVALPLLVVGLVLSRVESAPPAPPVVPGTASLWVLLPELWGWLRGAPEGPAAAASVSWVFGDNLLILGLQTALKGPLREDQAVYAHPVFLAAWFGMLVTMLNLVPLGQLDGGHLTHAWFGDRAVPLGKALAAFMGLLAVFCSASWLVWLVVTTQVVGFRHPPVVEPSVPLTPGRKLVCALCFACFVLTLMPVPVQQGGLP